MIKKVCAGQLLRLLNSSDHYRDWLILGFFPSSKRIGAPMMWHAMLVAKEEYVLEASDGDIIRLGESVWLQCA